MDIALNDSMRKLDVTLYGNVEPLSDTLSKCRVRIFYRGLNRNRTFISEDFANQLIKSLPYAPIKGIFDKETIDFEDHGEDNTDGRIYGVVSENPNFAWEKHLDKDGIEREYACADVILYTALYPEANLISGKSQSMEIHQQGLTGEWKIWNGDRQPYYEFHTGHLLGLQVLGSEVEPCFEGSAFFSLYKDAKDLYDYIKNSNAKEESEKMDYSKFKLSDDEKFSLLMSALNPDANSYTWVTTVYDDYAIAHDYVAGKFIRAYYTKTDDSVIIDKVEDCFIIDVNSAEKAALEALKSTYAYTDIQTKIDEYTNQIDTMKAEAEDAANKYSQLEAELEEFKKKDDKKDDDNDDDKDDNDDANTGSDDDDSKDDSNDDDDKKKKDKSKHSLDDSVVTDYENKITEKDAEIARLNQLIFDINNEKAELESFKLNADKEKKEEILKEFSAHLTEDQVQTYTENIDKYSVEDFKKEVCVAAYDTDSSLFSKKDSDDMIYKTNSDKSVETGALKLLSKHKGGNR